MEPVFQVLVIDPEGGVVGVHPLSARGLQLDLQLLVVTFGQKVNVVITEPELSAQITKTSLVVSPVSEEVYMTILSMLENLD